MTFLNKLRHHPMICKAPYKIACSAILALVVSGAAAAAQEATTLVFAHTKKDEAFQTKISKYVADFEAVNPGIKINILHADPMTRKHLPLAFKIGVAPDIAFTSEFGQTSHYLELSDYLEAPATFKKAHNDSFQHLRSADQKGAVNGFIWNKTLNQPFVNVSLFKQAGVPLPRPGATINEIVRASAEVAQATGTKYAFAIDRSSHRWSGLAYSYGSYLEQGDKITFPDTAARSLIKDMYTWVDAGYFAKEFWGIAGGQNRIDMGSAFRKQELVTYFSGNWQVAGFSKDIGRRFEWTALDAPCGPSDCFPMPGGDALIGNKETKHPAEVAKFIEFMGSKEVQLDFATSLLNMPGGDFGQIDYGSSDPNVNQAMAVFLRNRGKSNPQHQETLNSTAPDGLGKVVLARLSQLFMGELSYEDAMALMEKDVKALNEG